MQHSIPDGQNTQDRRVALGVCLAVTVGAVGVYKAIESLVSPALPIIQAELGATRAEVTWVMTGVLLTGPLVTPLISRLADIYDKRKLIMAIMLIVATGTLVSSLSASMQMLIIGQLLQGFGLSMVPLAVGIMKDTQPASVLKFSNSLMISAIYGSTALGMLIAGPIADNYHYTYLFWAPFLALLILIAAAWVLLPPCPSKSKTRPSIDVKGLLLFAVALGTFLIGLTYAPEWGWGSTSFLSICAVSLCSLLAFIWAELTHKDPLVELRVLRSFSVTSGLILMMAAGYVINSFFVSVPMQAQQSLSTGYGLGATATLTSLILVPGVLIGVASPIVNLVERYAGLASASVVGPLIMGVGFWLALESAGSLPLVIISMLCAGLGSGITITQAMNLMVMGVPDDRVGTFTGLNFVAKAIGATTGAQVVGGLLSGASGDASQAPEWSNFVYVFSMGLAICMIAIVCAFIGSRAFNKSYANATTENAA